LVIRNRRQGVGEREQGVQGKKRSRGSKQSRGDGEEEKQGE
jgi:hypothetical protein